jgi:hypothetical protein
LAAHKILTLVFHRIHYYIFTETVTLLMVQSTACASTHDLLLLLSKSHIMTQVQNILIQISTSILYLGAGKTLSVIK